MKIKAIPLTLACVTIAAGLFLFDNSRHSATKPSETGTTPLSNPAKFLGEEAGPNPSQPHQAANFQQRFDLLDAQENGPEKVKATTKLFEEWGAAEGEAAFLFSQTLTGRDHLNYIASAVAGWAKVAPRDAWAAMMSISNHGKMLERQVGLVIESIAQQDGLLATDLLSQVESQYNRTNLFNRVVNQLATDQDRHDVLDKLLDSELTGKEFLVQSLFRNWGRYDSAAPLARLANIADPKLSDQAMKGILSGWASVDGEGAFEYVLESGDPQLIKNALPPIAKEWALSSTADEMKKLIQQISTLDQSDSILKGLVPTLAQANPQLALDSIAAFENETARANHTRDALKIWADANLDEAEAYFSALPPGRTKEFAIWGLFGPAIHQGAPPERIMQHIDYLGDPTAIGRALYSMSDYTQAVDLGEQTEQLAAAIKTYVDQSADLSDEFRQKILDNLDRPRD